MNINAQIVFLLSVYTPNFLSYSWNLPTNVDGNRFFMEMFVCLVHTRVLSHIFECFSVSVNVIWFAFVFLDMVAITSRNNQELADETKQNIPIDRLKDLCAPLQRPLIKCFEIKNSMNVYCVFLGCSSTSHCIPHKIPI